MLNLNYVPRKIYLKRFYSTKFMTYLQGFVF